MPAEWHPHAATQLHWPSNRETWPGERLGRVEEVFLDIIGHLHRHETVILLADPSVIRRAERKLKGRDIDTGKIRLIEQPLNDVWARDCGPIFIHNGRNGESLYAVTDWEYNAWGEKYPPWQDDNRLPAVLAERFGLPLFRTGMVLEGGSIETNGEGVFLTTESVLLNPNRNPELDKDSVERNLGAYLGAEEIVWLKDGLAGDDTDGHVDDLCRFLDENTVVTVLSEDPGDVNYPVLMENFRRLRHWSEQRERPVTIEVLPLPGTQIEGTTVDGSQYVPASYANFYIANGIVLVPLYDKRYDELALDLMRRHFPDREIAGIHCADLVWGQGSIHCVTQQLYGI